MRFSTDTVAAALPRAVLALAGSPTRVRATTWHLDPGAVAGVRRLAGPTR